MKPEKLRLLLFSLREVATVFIAALEDALEIPYYDSLLASRFKKARIGQ